MRTISANALEKLQARLGTEPVVILEIQWVQDGGWSMYADRDIDTTVTGKIMSLGALDDVVSISDNEDSQELEVTLDDTDGSLKTIIDTYDIHKRDVRVWQWFDGLALTDKFLLFSGKINSPIVWSEGDRTLSFSIVSQLEDTEFGFSPEEGQFTFIPEKLIGVPWPSIFGTPYDVPVVRIGEAVVGTTLAGIGTITDGVPEVTGTSQLAATAAGLASAFAQMGHVSYLATAWANHDDDLSEKYSNQQSDLLEQINQALSNASSSTTSTWGNTSGVLTADTGGNPVRILNGEFFPRGIITLSIGTGLFTGHFGSGDDDNLFYITSRTNPTDIDEIAKTDRGVQTYSSIPGQSWDYVDRVPGGWYETEGWSAGASVSSTLSEIEPKFTFMNAGTRVTLYGNEPITYIVSIVPGTVLSVKAFKSFNGVSHFLDVPSNLYTVHNVTYGSISTVQITLSKTLSTLEDEGWSDDLYVTFESDVGPNIVDILEYIIDLYTDFSIDTTSFNHVSTLLADLPANFAVLDRKNVFTILQEIAFQACCNLRLINGVFYLTYLPEAPTPITTITETDIDFNTLSVEASHTEDLVTKMMISWRTSYAHDENTMIIRYNVKKYGIQEESFDFYLYNVADLVQKAATFWAIRKGNTWKNVKFNTFMNKLNLETFDCVTLDFNTPYIATGPINAVIKTAEVDTENYSISFDCWTPIKFGTMGRYDFAWLTDVSVTNIFPTENETAWGYGGGGGLGVDAVGTLPEAPKDGGTSWGSPSGGGGTGLNVSLAEEKKIGINSGHSDRGNNKPQDFTPEEWETHQTAYQAYRSAKTNNIEIDTVYPTKPTKRTNTPPPTFPGIEGLKEKPTIVCDLIDIHRTKVIDSGFDLDVVTSLEDIFTMDQKSQDLAIKTTAKFSDDENVKEFDFKFDDVGEKWGAGTAFLKDEA